MVFLQPGTGNNIIFYAESRNDFLENMYEHCPYLGLYSLKLLDTHVYMHTSCIIDKLGVVFWCHC